VIVSVGVTVGDGVSDGSGVSVGETAVEIRVGPIATVEVAIPFSDGAADCAKSMALRKTAGFGRSSPEEQADKRSGRIIETIQR
jgi:hypothetical protein